MRHPFHRAGILCASAAAATVGAASACAAPLRIMPLGDSITFGSTDPTAGGWRAPLFQSLLEDDRLYDLGYDGVDFKGSVYRTPYENNQFQYDGPSTVSVTRNGVTANVPFDHDHEGHSGWRIDNFLANDTVYTDRIPRNSRGGDGNTLSNESGLGLKEHLPVIFDPTKQGRYLNSAGPMIDDGITDPVSGPHGYGTNPNDLDAVVLMIGINDVRRGEGMFYKDGDTYHDYTLSDEEYAVNRLLGLIDALVNPDSGYLGEHTHLYVSTLLPVEPTGNNNSYPESFPSDYPHQGNDDLLELIQRFNEDLKTAFEALYGDSDRVHLLDAYGQLVDEDGDPGNYFTDRLHLNASANQILGGFFADSILATIPEPSSLALLLLASGTVLARRRG